MSFQCKYQMSELNILMLILFFSDCKKCGWVLRVLNRLWLTYLPDLITFWISNIKQFLYVASKKVAEYITSKSKVLSRWQTDCAKYFFYKNYQKNNIQYTKYTIEHQIMTKYGFSLKPQEKQVYLKICNMYKVFT